MPFNFKPFLDAIPGITSAYSLIAFVFTIFSVVIVFVLKINGPIVRIIEKKLTKAQAFILLQRIALYSFLFAIFVFFLGYITELSKIFAHKATQTSVLIYDKSFDISETLPYKNKHSGYFIASEPTFSIPAPDLTTWEKPIWVNKKEDLANFIKLSLPKEIDFNGPFFDFLSSGKAVLILSIKKADLIIDKLSTVPVSSPFETKGDLDYPFDEPLVINGRHHLAIISVPKSELSSKFKTVDIPKLVAFYIHDFSITPDQLITTKNNAVIIAKASFNKIIYQGNRQNITIFKCIRFINSSTHIYILEGTCYAPDSNPEIRSYITDAIFNFILPENA